MTSKNLSIYKESSHPFVSVIMNCYNSDKYLEEALESVVAQTFHNWEIIFWDNQSTDKSAEIFKSFKDKRFCYFLAPDHTTLGKARNLAVEKARGEWVAFLDCDDLWFPEKLLKQVEIIKEEGDELGLVYGRSEILVEESGLQTDMGKRMEAFRKKKVEQPLPEGNIFPNLLKFNFVPLLSSIVRRSSYWSVGGIDPIYQLGEDYDLFVKISKDYKVRALQESTCCYRVHRSNQSHKLIDGCHELLKIVSKYLPMPEAKIGMRQHQTSLAVEEMRQGFILKGIISLMRGDISLFILKLVQFLQSDKKT